MKKTLTYKTEQIEDNVRIITVFTEGSQLTEIECWGGFLTDKEQIQSWLDDNGFGDEEFYFVKLN